MSPVRWAVFLVLVLSSVPAARWLKERPDVRLRLWTLMGILPFLPPFRLALWLFSGAPSDTHGFETMPLLDGLALCLYSASKPRRGPAPYRFALGFYLLTVFASIAQARWPLLVVGYAWTVLRMVLLVLAIWRAGSEDSRVVGALLRGMMIGMLCEAGQASWQRLGQGLLRASGSFSGWNALGMALNLVVMVPVARILAGRTSLLTKLAPIGVLIADFFTVSRGALLFLGIGVGLVWLGSVTKEFSPRKGWFGLAGLLLVAAIVPIAISNVESRAQEEREESMETRGHLKDAAALMLAEHPLGVGASHYMPELLLGGYGRRVGLGWRAWTTIVHNIYWLTAAELGYLGVVALVVLFVAPILQALRRRPRGPRGDILLGLGVGLLMFSIHSCLEWAWRLSELSYVYFTCIALVAVVSRPVRRASALPVRQGVDETSARPHRLGVTCTR